MSSIPTNPLSQVLTALGESVPCVGYDRWVTHLGDGAPASPFNVIADGEAFRRMVRAQGGAAAAEQWGRLERVMAPLAAGVSALPAAALRADLGVAATALAAGDPLALLRAGLGATQLTGPFSNLLKAAGVTDPWLCAWLDLESFVLSGLPASATIAAELVFMFYERHKVGGKGAPAKLEYPLGGSAALVSALVRGLEKNGGRLVTRAAVSSVLLEGGRASGVVVAPAGAGVSSSPVTLRARKGVISNASAWDTARLLPGGSGAPLATPATARLAAAASSTPPLRSFMHLFVGIDADGLPPGGAEEGHHLLVRDFAPHPALSAPQNVAIVAVPSVFDRALAPAGCATLHAYTAANEPWELWEGLDRRSEGYKKLKEERARVLWQALERVVAPDVRARAKVSLIGTPLTHARFLRRHQGTYGPAIDVGTGGTFPGPATGVPGLWRCGDSCAPGVGVPAAAASGLILANTLGGVREHLELLKDLGGGGKK